MGNTFIAYMCDSNTVESSLFVEDQCLWLSWVALVHECTPPWTFILVKHLCNIHLRSRTCYQRNYDPTNQENFCYSRTLTPMNKNDSTVTISFCRSREHYTRWIKNIKIFVKHFGIRLIKVNIMDKNLTVQIYVKLVSVVTGEK